MKLVKAFFSNDVVERALKTFVQTLLATVALGVTSVVDWNTAKAVFLSALAAAFSAAWNSLRQ